MAEAELADPLPLFYRKSDLDTRVSVGVGAGECPTADSPGDVPHEGIGRLVEGERGPGSNEYPLHTLDQVSRACDGRWHEEGTCRGSVRSQPDRQRASRCQDILSRPVRAYEKKGCCRVVARNFLVGAGAVTARQSDRGTQGRDDRSRRKVHGYLPWTVVRWVENDTSTISGTVASAASSVSVEYPHPSTITPEIAPAVAPASPITRSDSP